MLFSFTAFAKPSEALGLTAAQKTWLENHPVIRVAPDIDWPPFERVDDNQQYQGMAADYIRLVEEKLGIQFAIEKNKPWSEVVSAVKNQELDLYSCVAKNQDRLEYVNFTRPYLSFPMVMITTNDVSHIDGIRA